MGRATALVFAAAGARLMLTDVRAAELEKTTADVKAAGGAVASVVADFSRPEAPADVVAAAVRAWGRLDVLFKQRRASARSRPTHAYATSKGAVLSLTRAMAATYAPNRIRVNAICPGTIRTRLTADIIERVERDTTEGRGIPLGRVGEPEDIARCALFLASDDSAWITRIEIVVDGGAEAASS